MRAQISNEGWAAIYELIQSNVPRKAVALEFGVNCNYLAKKIRKLEREGLK